MKRVTAATMVFLLAVALPSVADRRRATAPPINPLTIAFLDAGSSDASLTAAGSDAWLDLSTVTHQGAANERSTRIRRKFGIRVLRDGSAGRGSATITARLGSWDGRATYRLDGQTLTAALFTVDPHATFGTVTMHTLEIDIPTTESEGSLAASIQWEATSN
jgi:hypothetical protein